MSVVSQLTEEIRALRVKLNDDVAEIGRRFESEAKTQLNTNTTLRQRLTWLIEQNNTITDISKNTLLAVKDAIKRLDDIEKLVQSIRITRKRDDAV